MVTRVVQGHALHAILLNLSRTGVGRYPEGKHHRAILHVIVVDLWFTRRMRCAEEAWIVPARPRAPRNCQARDRRATFAVGSASNRHADLVSRIRSKAEPSHSQVLVNDHGIVAVLAEDDGVGSIYSSTE